MEQKWQAGEIAKRPQLSAIGPKTVPTEPTKVGVAGIIPNKPAAIATPSDMRTTAERKERHDANEFGFTAKPLFPVIRIGI
jgi:hypothetical protein